MIFPRSGRWWPKLAGRTAPKTSGRRCRLAGLGAPWNRTMETLSASRFGGQWNRTRVGLDWSLSRLVLGDAASGGRS